MTTVMNQPTAEPGAHGVAQARGLFDGPIMRQALKDSLTKLDPRLQVKNPVMFVVLVGSVISLFEAFAHPSTFTWSITIWLFLTVIFANFAEAMAEGRGKAQAETLRKMRSETEARRLRPDGTEELVPAASLSKGDLVVCEVNDVIPSDGEIVEGIASVDESAITGESAPVIRESGGDRSAVTGGTKVLSDRIVVRITAERGHTFIDRMISLVRRRQPPEDPERDRPHDIARRADHRFHPGCGHSGTLRQLRPRFRVGRGAGGPPGLPHPYDDRRVVVSHRHRGHGPSRPAQRASDERTGRRSGRDVQTLLLDKTGTITLGNAWRPTSTRWLDTASKRSRR